MPIIGELERVYTVTTDALWEQGKHAPEIHRAGLAAVRDAVIEGLVRDAEDMFAAVVLYGMTPQDSASVRLVDWLHSHKETTP